MKCLIFLIIWTIFINYTSAQNCVPSDLTGILYINNPITDEQTGLIAKLEIKNIISFTVQGDADVIPYFDLSATVNDEIIVSLTDAFQNFEHNTISQSSHQPIALSISTTCSSGTGSMVFQQQILDINNHDPEFGQLEYTYNLPMPFPSGVEITQFGIDIIATDIDFTNNNITFTSLSDDLIVSWSGTVDTLNKQHRAILTARRPLEITSSETFYITATDTGVPPITTQASITIVIDEENSVQAAPMFDDAYYEINYDDSSTPHTAGTTMKIIHGESAIFTVDGEYSGYFNFENNDGEVDVELIRNFDEDIIDAGGYVPIVVRATVSETKYTRTVLIVKMPIREEVTTECPTSTPEITTTPAPCPTCEDCTTPVEQECTTVALDCSLCTTTTDATSINDCTTPVLDCSQCSDEICTTTVTSTDPTTSCDSTTVALDCSQCSDEICTTTVGSTDTTTSFDCSQCSDEICTTTVRSTDTTTSCDCSQCSDEICTTTVGSTDTTTSFDCSECSDEICTTTVGSTDATTSCDCTTVALDCSQCTTLPSDYECSSTVTNCPSCEYSSTTECDCSSTVTVCPESTTSALDCSLCTTTPNTDLSDTTDFCDCTTVALDCSKCSTVPPDYDCTSTYTSPVTSPECDCSSTVSDCPEVDCSLTTSCPDVDCSTCFTSTTGPAEITFPNAPFIFILSATETLTGKYNLPLTAKSNIEESISYALEGDVPPELDFDATTAILTNNAFLPSGRHGFNVIARGSESGLTASAPVTIRVVAVEICSDEARLSYSLFVTSVMENTVADFLLIDELDDDNLLLEIVSVSPEAGADLFYATTEGIHCSELNREASHLADMATAQYTITVKLSNAAVDENTYFKEYRNDIFGISNAQPRASTKADSDQCILLESIITNPTETVISLIVGDENDNAPVFSTTSMVIGYPIKSILPRVAPAYLVQVEATDADIGANAELAYDVTGSRVTINSTTGVIYPTENMLDDESEFTFDVTARDRNGDGLKSNTLQIRVKPLEEQHISVLTLKNIHLEDLDKKIAELNNIANINILQLQAKVLPTSDLTRQVRADDDNYLVVIGYALDADRNLITSDVLIELLEEVDDLSVDSLYDSGVVASGSNSGLIAAVSVLSVLLFLILIGFFAFYYFVLRKGKSYKQMPEETDSNINPYTKNPYTGRSSSKLGQEPEKLSRRPTGIVLTGPIGGDTDDAVDGTTDGTPPRERRKSVVFNNNVEQINIDTTQDSDDNLENSKL